MPFGVNDTLRRATYCTGDELPQHHAKQDIRRVLAERLAKDGAENDSENGRQNERVNKQPNRADVRAAKPSPQIAVGEVQHQMAVAPALRQVVSDLSEHMPVAQICTMH